MKYRTNKEDKLSLLVLCLEITTCLCANLYKSKLDKNTKIPLTRILFSSTLRKILFTVFSENLKLKWSPSSFFKNASYVAKNVSAKLSYASVYNKSNRFNSGCSFWRCCGISLQIVNSFFLWLTDCLLLAFTFYVKEYIDFYFFLKLDTFMIFFFVIKNVFLQHLLHSKFFTLKNLFYFQFAYLSWRISQDLIVFCFWLGSLYIF